MARGHFFTRLVVYALLLWPFSGDAGPPPAADAPGPGPPALRALARRYETAEETLPAANIHFDYTPQAELTARLSLLRPFTSGGALMTAYKPVSDTSAGRRVLLVPSAEWAEARLHPVFDLNAVRQGTLRAWLMDAPGPERRFRLVRWDLLRYYRLDAGAGPVDIPFVYGGGTYDVYVEEKDANGRFDAVLLLTLDVALDEATAYLQSNRFLRYDDTMAAIRHFRAVYDAAPDAEGFIRAVHAELTATLAYDLAKQDAVVEAGYVLSTYLPDIEETFASKTGICYDFAALLCCVLRSNGIQARLTVGRCDAVDTLHSWVEVKAGGVWRIMDLTVDVFYGETAEVYKNPEEYHTQYAY